jgi:hypothetical protein
MIMRACLPQPAASARGGPPLVAYEVEPAAHLAGEGGEGAAVGAGRWRVGWGGGDDYRHLDFFLRRRGPPLVLHGHIGARACV